MSPTTIRTGRQFYSMPALVSLPNAAETQVATGDGNRVGLVVALTVAGAAQLAATAIAVGVVVDGSLIPLTTINAGHPVCYLSVDKIGPILFAPIVATQTSGGAVVVGVTTVRQVTELP